MHAQVNAPLPAHDEKTDAALLYGETNVNVISSDKIKITVRRAYKILRPGGREYGTVVVFLNSNRKVTSLHGWSIPAQGKDYEVKDKDAMEVSPPKVEGSELVADVKARVLHIPAADPVILSDTSTKLRNIPCYCKRVGIFRRRIQFGKSTTRCSCPAAGNTRCHG